MMGTGILGMLGLGSPGISNTLDLGGEQKIQDYLAGAGNVTTGPGGSTLYTGGGSMPLPTVSREPGPINARPPGFVDRPGGPIIDPGRDPNFMGRPGDPNFIGRPVMPRPGPGFPNPGIGGGIGGIGGGIGLPFPGGPGMPGGILPQPSPSPGQPNFGQFKDDLLSGIGDLFKQYFDQQQDTPSINEPFDQDNLGSSNQMNPPPLGSIEQTNFGPNNFGTQQAFGSMLTPFGRQQ
jgi:hypothetical protein